MLLWTAVRSERVGIARHLKPGVDADLVQQCIEVHRVAKRNWEVNELSRVVTVLKNDSLFSALRICVDREA